MKRIVVDVSGHGLGHLSQTATVLARLRARYRDAQIILRTAYSPQVVADFIGEPIECAPLPAEPSLLMKGPLAIDREAVAAAYRDFHADWERHVASRADALASLRPDLLVSNIPYASLAAAARLSIPAVGLCCLNWLDMRAAYCASGDRIAEQIEAAYQSAAVFLQPAPHMPMTYLGNRRSIGPIGRIGARRGDEMRARLGLGAGQRLVLVTFGGVPGAHALPLPQDPDIFWIVQHRWEATVANAACAADLPIPFIDILASVDAVIAKDGYSTLVEAACNGARMLMLTRPDWPETPFLVEWAERNSRFSSLPYASADKALGAALRGLLVQEPAPPLEPTGIDEAVEAIAMIAHL